MTTRESKRGWIALMPTGEVRFKRPQGASHKVEEVDTPSYLGDHCKLTDVGEKFFFGYAARYLG